MTTQRTGASWRAFGKPVLAGVLVLLLLFSALASASPCLHEWLHTDHQAPSHYCLVTVLEHGATDTVSLWDYSPLPVLPEIVTAVPLESFFVSHDLTLHPDRGPPVLS